MINICKKSNWLIIVGILMVSIVACGNNGTGDNTEMIEPTEEVQETESEFQLEIIDGTDILTKIWDEYKIEERFEIMGGHFDAGVIGLPAKYDLNQTTDLVQMYCVPEQYLSVVDDAATMIDLYNAARFTAGVFHVTDVEKMETFMQEIQIQVTSNTWHGEVPEKLLVIKIGEQYVVSVYGREALVDEFEQKLLEIYSKIANVVIEQTIS